MKYYIDTCVWRDYYENRKSAKRNLGKEAHELVTKIIKRKDTIIYSDILIWELQKRYTLNKINELLQVFFIIGILQKVIITKEENEEAKLLSKKRNIPYGDCLQVIQARNHNAQMISQDKHLLKALQDIVITKRPKKII